MQLCYNAFWYITEGNQELKSAYYHTYGSMTYNQNNNFYDLSLLKDSF